MNIRILAHDPGFRNYGWCCIDFSAGPKTVRPKIVVRECSQLQDMATEMKTRLREQLLSYLAEIQTHWIRHRPQYFIAERYMTRGIKGMTVEVINVMLGSLVSRVKVPHVLVPASQWKNEVKRWGIDLDAVYAQTWITPHQIDACFMGLYMGWKLCRCETRPQINVKLLLRQLEKVTTHTDAKIERRRIKMTKLRKAK